VPGSAGSTGQGTNVLPVTGTSVWLWLAPAVLFIYVGLLALGATSRKRRRTLNS
jgi:cytochrome c-type biogenesis protein CcmH/NrfF